MIKACTLQDFTQILSIINDAAVLYKNILPSELWKQPYMSEEELKNEIGSGIKFWGYVEKNRLIGIMGIQNVKDVTLIRHAYVLRKNQRKGIGTKLLSKLIKMTNKPVLIGTWMKAKWAINFYIKNGFILIKNKEKDLLLRKYWIVPEWQIQMSVVLANTDWFKREEIL